MLNKIIRWYFTLPRIKFNFKNIFSIYKLDDRSYDWYKCRKKYGFDERELWNLGSNLDYIITEYLDIKRTKNKYGDLESINISLTQFLEWFKNDIIGVEWFSNRVNAYNDWDCPTFFMDKTKDDYSNLPDDKQKEIMNKMCELLKSDNHIDDKEIEYVYEHVFKLGW